MNDQLDVIEKVMASGSAFAFWRMPGEEVINCICSESTQKLSYSELPLLLNQHGYLIAPFDIGEYPFIFIPGIPMSMNDFRDKSFSLSQIDDSELVSEISVSLREDYLAQAQLIIDEIKSGSLEKVILSRQLEVLLSLEKANKVFLALCDAYPNAYVFFYSTPETGAWMAATPELFLTKRKTKFETVALAGTRQVSDDNSFEWGGKERYEQVVVTKYIQSILDGFSISDLIVDQPKTVNAGKVSHLKTNFSFTLNQSNSVIVDLINRLHPTPALCGYPKEKAMDLIRQIEKHKRSYYGGFSGDISSDGFRFFVSIRCMQLLRDKAILYVGGGLTSLSVPELEWDETELKAQTLLSVLKNI